MHAEQQQRGGPSGLNVNGRRPTSSDGWAAMAEVLRTNNLRCLSPQEVIFAQRRGIPVIDVRPAEDYSGGHVPGAVNVPFYQPITGWTPWQLARRVGYALFGVLNGTEPNPNFIAEVAAVLADSSSTSTSSDSSSNSSSTGARSSVEGVAEADGCSTGGLTSIVYCSLGGTMDRSTHNPNGRQTRSLIAAHELISRGYCGVAVLKLGYDEWALSGRDVEVEGEESDGGSSSDGDRERGQRQLWDQQ